MARYWGAGTSNRVKLINYWFLPSQLGHKEIWPVDRFTKKFRPWLNLSWGHRRHVLPQLVQKELWRVARSPLGTPSACRHPTFHPPLWFCIVLLFPALRKVHSDAGSGSLNLPQSLVIMLVVFHFLIFFIQQWIMIYSHLRPLRHAFPLYVGLDFRFTLQTFRPFVHVDEKTAQLCFCVFISFHAKQGVPASNCISYLDFTLTSIVGIHQDSPSASTMRIYFKFQWCIGLTLLNSTTKLATRPVRPA